MTTIAWVSRHTPLKAQLEYFKQKLGNYTLYHISQTFKDAQHVLDQIKQLQCKYAVVVLPLWVIAKLVQDKSIVWLYPEMEKLHENCNGCSEFNPDTDVIVKGRHYRFRDFKVIEEVKVVFKDWEVEEQ